MSSSKEEEQPKLPEYHHQPLTTPDYLRLLRLIPAKDEQEDIDCEIIEPPLPDDSKGKAKAADGTKLKDRNDKPDEYSNSNETHPTNNVPGPALPDEPESEDDEVVAPPNGHSNNAKDIPEKPSEERPAPHDQPRNSKEPIPEKTSQHIDDKRYSYEAVSWCWGREPQDRILRVHRGDDVYAFRVSRNLRTALWALRKSNEVRQLWIDAVCIDQNNIKERNEQVPRMDKIYGKAKNVCIWLGEGDNDSKVAMEFIREKVLKIWDFDELIENREMAKQWAALIRLMKRPWFSRRWVVQEIALSTEGGTLYCGKEHTSWQDFADAVSLFVEVESATHRLSDVMRLDTSFGNLPDFFGDVSSLGAALLVDATSNLFRNAKLTGERTPLSTLEYLVSRLSVFEATQPRDTIYALLAISKDTVPHNLGSASKIPVTSKSEKTAKAALALAPKKGFAIQNYNVDYTLPVIDVYQEFIEFAMRKSERTRALDIVCRPWVPTVMKSHDDPDFKDDPSGEGKTKAKSNGKEKEKEKENVERKAKRPDKEIPLPSWIPSLNRAAFEMEEHPFVGLRMERQNADPLVGLPDYGHRNYSAAETRELKKWSMFVQGFVLTEVASVEQIASNGNIPYRWLMAGGWTNTGENPPEDFWRTLVADRGHGGRNPPTYFPRACKESMKFKAKTKSKSGGNLDSKKMINEGRCTIVAEFLRRVQEVIWNRQLMKTKDGRLGLVRDDISPGFKVCILYGCSVPVILQEIRKDPKNLKELKAERRDRYKLWRKDLERGVAVVEARYQMKLLRRERSMKAQQPHAEEDSTEQPTNGVGPGSVGDSTSQQDTTTAPAENAVIGNGESSEGAASETPPKATETDSSNTEQEHRRRPQSSGNMPKIQRRKTVLEELTEGKKLFLARISKERNRMPPMSYYRLVGECYVHGMMNGEAIAVQNLLEIPEQTFELR